jgi:predicted membrane protein DUF2142
VTRLGWHIFRLRRRDPKTRFVTGVLLMGLAWAFANPPLAAPDEAEHLIRAVGIEQGHLIGAPAPGLEIGFSPEEIRYDRQTQRAVVVPARLDPLPYECYVTDPHLSAQCLNRLPPAGPPVRRITTVGTYPPLPLLTAAAVLPAADDPLEAVWFGRIAGLLTRLLLLAWAVWVLYRRRDGWLSLAGLIAACTPTTIFLMASLNPSGLSVSAGIALSCCLLALGGGERGLRRTWLLLGISGTTLMLSHPTGPEWTLLLVGGFIAITGARRSWQLMRDHFRVAWQGLGILALGAGVAVFWNLRYGATTGIDTGGLDHALAQAPGNYWDFTRQLIGVFGYLEFRLPRVLYLAWLGSIAALAAAACAVGSRKDRRLLAAAGALAVVAPICLWMLFGRAIGNGMAGRLYLPVMVAFPLSCGEVVYRHREKLRPPLVSAIALFGASTGVVQFAAWYLNGRRSAVGMDGPLLFPLHAHWTPPLGWPLWVACAAAGALLLGSLPLRLRERAVALGSEAAAG